MAFALVNDLQGILICVERKCIKVIILNKRLIDCLTNMGGVGAVLQRYLIFPQSKIIFSQATKKRKRKKPCLTGRWMSEVGPVGWDFFFIIIISFWGKNDHKKC